MRSDARHGSQNVNFHPLFYDPNGSATYTLDCPIDIREADYVQLRDGTCLPVPEG